MGARIADIIHARENSFYESIQEERGSRDATNTSGNIYNKVPHHQASDGPKHRRSRLRRHHIIIHSSPFLRCVQTSIAISAGIAEQHKFAQNSTRTRPSSQHSNSSKYHSRTSSSSHLEAIPEPDADIAAFLMKHQIPPRNFTKTTLRLDAFLGEWLSPDYFEDIMPPPSSVMMVADAKAVLLRQGDYSTLINGDGTGFQAFPGGWGSVYSSESQAQDGPLSRNLPQRDRASSHGSAAAVNSLSHKVSKLNTNTSLSVDGYTPPTPTYAISSSEPIPSGYVAHARDACVDVDYQWDSMREPLDWGNGGEYGEEWSMMHKRFRRGLSKMIMWYKEQEFSEKPSVALHNNEGANENAIEDDEEMDTILVLVTHGAGCNALIGALTNQPVLIDVGMASLTMAVRKDILSQTPSPATTETHDSTATRRRSSISAGISDHYDVKLVASSEHLRAGSNPLQNRGLSSPTSQGFYRTRIGSSSDAQGYRMFSYDDGRRGSMNSSIGSIRRAANNPASFSKSMTTSPISNGMPGLWSPQIHAISDDEDGSGDDMVLNFGDSGDAGTTRPSEKPAEKSIEKTVAESVSLEKKNQKPDEGLEKPKNEAISDLTPSTNGSLIGAKSQRGLWGAAPVIADTFDDTQRTPTKRRWTVNER